MFRTNIVEHAELHKAQRTVLTILKNALVNSFGPMGSNTQIFKTGKYNKYTKDGFSIIEEIRHQHSIEAYNIQDIIDITRNIVLTVGDGTTSAIILSSLIFDKISDYKIDGKPLLESYPPVQIARMINSVAENIATTVRNKTNKTTPKDIYNISLIATNGNTKIASNMKTLYEKYGNDAFIDVNISNTEDTLIKEYDGMTLEIGYANPCFVNNSKGSSSIRNPRIYAFHDPIDTIEMSSFLFKIIQNNIFNEKTKQYIPTVILAPKIGGDINVQIKTLIENLNTVEPAMRPPLLIVTNIVDIDRYDDIVQMIGAKWIKKYLDPKMQEKHIKEGLAPSIYNIADWYGTADLVESTARSTQFINPKEFWETNEKDERVHSKVYNAHIEFLEANLEEAKNNNESASEIGRLKRRINSLKANMVEYLVGGISPADRDSERDLVEDAVLNCRSAARTGYGFGSNVEGALAIRDITNKKLKQPQMQSQLEFVITEVFNEAYYELLTVLVKTLRLSDEKTKEIVDGIYINKKPYNLVSKQYDDLVISSIESDPVIITSIAKILSIMVTSNQCILQDPALNVYSQPENYPEV